MKVINIYLSNKEELDYQFLNFTKLSKQLIKTESGRRMNKIREKIKSNKCNYTYFVPLYIAF